MGRPFNKDGLTAKERHACEIRSEGMTQIDAYRLSHKDKSKDRGPLEDKAYRLFHKPAVITYLRELWDAKPLEEIITRQEWLGTILDDIQRCREAKNWNGLANLQRQAGQAIAALREGLVAVKDGADVDRELIAALAGEDPVKRKALTLLMGKHEVFETPHVVVDNTKPDEKKDKS